MDVFLSFSMNICVCSPIRGLIIMFQNQHSREVFKSLDIHIHVSFRGQEYYSIILNGTT